MKKEISSLKERNDRVELDKAWEISKTRKAIIAVPVAGFLLSTLTLQFFKKLWIKKYKITSS
jgi:hypothetical protein